MKNQTPKTITISPKGELYLSMYITGEILGRNKDRVDEAKKLAKDSNSSIDIILK